jgi:hypothetical protein
MIEKKFVNPKWSGKPKFGYKEFLSEICKGNFKINAMQQFTKLGKEYTQYYLQLDNSDRKYYFWWDKQAKRKYIKFNVKAPSEWLQIHHIDINRADIIDRAGVVLANIQ